MKIENEDWEVNEEFFQELGRSVTEVHSDRITRLLYSTDASIYQILPIGVAMPRDADEIIAAVEIAGRHGIPILPRGGGSSLAGQAVGQALVLDLSCHLRHVLEIDPEQRTVRTQPGISLNGLNRILKPHGLMFGPDPASGERATMGGILGNNSTGAHSTVYGMTVDHVLATDVILSDGSTIRLEALDKDRWEAHAIRPGLEGGIYRRIPQVVDRVADLVSARYPKTFRHVAGYNLNQLVNTPTPNLAKLIVGSEGTLAIIKEMTLNLVPIPKMTCLAMVHFSEFRRAMEAVPTILESQPTAIEVLDRMMLDLIENRTEYRRLLTFIEGNPEVLLIVEYSGEQEKELDAGIQRLRGKLAQLGHREPLIILSQPEQQANVWYVRKLALGILMSIRGDAKPIPFIEDAAVPVEHLADYVTNIYQFAHGVGVDQVAMYAHASAGCLHIRPLVNLKTGVGLRQLRQIAEKSVELVLEYGGTTSGEHGEGLARGEFSARLFGSEIAQAFREVKEIFDPASLLNPGKVVGAPRMDDETLLRFGPDYSAPMEIKQTVLDFSVDGGFAGAVEMCNGAGVCRQLGQGVMCPSFQATFQEGHSTRGRANALRAAMTGLLGAEGMTSQELFDVLDLCLSCNACKSECPSTVDMTKLKAEFLHNYYREHGKPLRSRLFSNIAKMYQIAQPIASLANTALRMSGKWVLPWVGIHQNRSIPEIAPRTFSRWFASRPQPGVAAPEGKPKQVVIFHDTFTEHNHPQVGIAAIRLLEAAGYQPIFLRDKGCCGRPAMSKGFLDLARDLAQHNVRLLAPFARKGIPIVGWEPSCMAMLVNEYLDLVPGEASKAISRQATMVDDLLAKAPALKRAESVFDDNPRKVLFHGNCQQKAIFGTESTREMLHLLPSLELKEIEAGCCGMAGSFGYEKEHYEFSIKLAEMVLAPEVRSASADTIICASGVSCRDQIEHTTGRMASHPVEVLASALREREAVAGGGIE